MLHCETVQETALLDRFRLNKQMYWTKPGDKITVGLGKVGSLNYSFGAIDAAIRTLILLGWTVDIITERVSDDGRILMFLVAK
jgi:hypothetical protein